MPETLIGKDIRLTHGWMHNWWVADWKLHKFCTNDPSAGERQLETAFCALFPITVVLTTSWRRWRPGPNIETHKKGDDGRFACSASHSTNVKAKYGWKWMQTLVEKLQMNGILCHAGSRWGEKYFQFWPNAICESHLGFYLSEMDIFEKFQFWARSSFSDGLNLTSGNFLEREVFQNPQIQIKKPCT